MPPRGRAHSARCPPARPSPAQPDRPCAILVAEDDAATGALLHAARHSRGAPMASSYRPLGAYLMHRPGPACTLSFREIEGHLGRALPPAAHMHHPLQPLHYGWRIQRAESRIKSRAWPTL